MSVIYVWDPVVRIFHWASVLIVVTNYWFAEAGEIWHSYLGYGLAALLSARCVWGFCGSKTARFSDFWPSFSRLKRYFQQRRDGRYPYIGHSPLAGLMVILLMLLMAVISISGWLQTLDYFWGEAWPHDIHQYAADSLMLAALVHIAAVFYQQRKTNVALILPMLTGKRKC